MPGLTATGATVTVSPDPPPAGCTEVEHLVGEGGGSFGGGYIPNHNLIDYAMNDLRNKAADAGANYVEYDPPTLGTDDGTTTTATVSGTAFKCPAR
jgi:hypothetical protein